MGHRAWGMEQIVFSNHALAVFGCSSWTSLSLWPVSLITLWEKLFFCLDLQEGLGFIVPDDHYHKPSPDIS
jgi:hypothetical protein